MIWVLILTYILPMLLSIAGIYHKSSQVTRGDLIGIILISALPIFNFFIGYVGGLIILCESIAINNFFNTRIK
jgi:hypothetical protein